MSTNNIMITDNKPITNILAETFSKNYLKKNVNTNAKL